MKYKSVLKKIIVGFIVALLVLTFFSQTIVDMRLPRVALGFSGPGTISNEAWAFGQVLATDYEGQFIVEAQFPAMMDFIRARNRAELQVFGGGQLEGVVGQIIPGGGTNTVIIDVESNDLVGGEFAEVLISDGRWQAPQVVPLSALRQGADGFYLLYVESVPRFLGRSYYVRATRVNIIRRDMWNASISGEWGTDEYEDTPIVIGSDMPVFNGARVRIVDLQDLE